MKSLRTKQRNNVFPKERRLESKASIRRFVTYLGKGGAGLWDHQNHAMGALGEFLDKSIGTISEGACASGAIVMPTGSGKTAIAAEITKALRTRTLILAPTVKIVQQHREELALRAPGLDASIYRLGNGLGSKVVVMTYHSAVNLMKKGELPDDFGVVFYDEAHRSISLERNKLHGTLSPIEIGLTATPEYDEMRHIWNAFGTNIYEMGLQEAVDSEVLSSLRGYIVSTGTDVRGVELKSGLDYLDEKKAEKHLNIIARNIRARDFYLKGFQGVPAVVFCISQKHAEGFARYLRDVGVAAEHVHGGMSIEKREDVLEDFEAGRLDVITSRDVLIEGWDSKRVILAMNLRPTYSRVVKAHMVGRVMRMRPGKKAGIFAEFQDMYDFGQQPVLVHHLLDKVNFRQGGLILAPPKAMAREERELSEGKEIKVHGKLRVSSKVRLVVNLSPNRKKYDFTDRKLLAEILESRPDIDWVNTPRTKLMDVRLNHPAYTGNLKTLIHKAFGLPNLTGGNLVKANEVDMFIWYALEDGMIASDNEMLEQQGPAGLELIGEPPTLLPQEEILRRIEVSKLMEKTLGRLGDNEKRIIRESFWDEKNFTEIAKNQDVGSERIAQRIRYAVREMRSPLARELLSENVESWETFNPDHAHRYELVRIGDYKVSLLQRPRYRYQSNKLQKPLEMDKFYRGRVENEVGELFQAIHESKNAHEMIEALRIQGIPSLEALEERDLDLLSIKKTIIEAWGAVYGKEIKEVRGYIIDRVLRSITNEVDWITGRKLSWEYVPKGVFREVGK